MERPDVQGEDLARARGPGGGLVGRHTLST